MTSLALAAIGFAALHLLVAGTRLRDVLVARLGEQAYRGAFSLASAVVLGWLIVAFARARVLQVSPLAGAKIAAAVLVFIAFVLMVLGLTTRAPTAVGAEKLLERGVEARGVHRVTRHPFLWGIALWALVHLVFNPDPANAWFFATFVVVAVAGTFSIDAKRARVYGQGWATYAAATSNLPFVAIAQGRNRLALGEIEFWKWAVAVAAFGAFLLFHARLFGLPSV